MIEKIKRNTIKLFLVFGSTVLLACSAPNQNPIISPNRDIVTEYTAAYNAKDIVSMSRLMHDEIEWINLNGSEQSIITGNKTELIGELGAYFEQDSRSVSSLSDWSVNGNFVAVKESVATPTDDGGTRVQASHSVYEFEDGLIRRVWYFPAHKQENLEIQ